MNITETQTYTRTTLRQILEQCGIKVSMGIDRYIQQCLTQQDNPDTPPPAGFTDTPLITPSALHDIIQLFISLIRADNSVTACDQPMTTLSDDLDRLLGLLPKDDENKEFIAPEKYAILEQLQASTPEQAEKLHQLKDKIKKQRKRITDLLRSKVKTAEWADLTSFVEDRHGVLEDIKKEARELREQAQDAARVLDTAKQAIFKAYDKRGERVPETALPTKTF